MYLSNSSRPASSARSSLAQILGSVSRQRPESVVDREQMVTERGSELLRRQRELRAQAATSQQLAASSGQTPRRPTSASRSGRSGCESDLPVPPAVDPFDLDARVEITEEIARRPPSRKNSAAFDLFSSRHVCERKPAILPAHTFQDRPQSRGLEPPAALHLDSPPTTPPVGPPLSLPVPSDEGVCLPTRPLSRPSSSLLGGQRTSRPPLRPTTSAGVFRPTTVAMAVVAVTPVRRRGHSAFRTSLDREFLGLFAN